VYVQDHVRALCCVLDKGKSGNTCNIGGKCEFNSLNTANKICGILDELQSTKSTCRDLIEFVEDWPEHDLHYAINRSKIKNELGWSATEIFEGGLCKTIIWHLDNQLWCKMFVPVITMVSGWKKQKTGICYRLKCVPCDYNEYNITR